MQDNIVKTLREALEGLQIERRTWEANVAIERKAFDARERVVKAAIDGLSSAAAVTAAAPTSLAISQKYIDQVAEYMEECGTSRQADIANNLGINSGTVSVALRRLLNVGKVTKGEKERGSQVWSYVVSSNGNSERASTPTANEGEQVAV